MRPIDADAFIQYIKETVERQKYENLKIDESLTVSDVLNAVISDLDGTSLCGFKNAPTIEPKHGNWIAKTLPLTLSDGHKDCVQCSNCKTHWDVATNYCPNCGARMERSEE